MEKAARFVACEMIEGDYLEFGTYQGGTFIDAYRSLEQQFQNRIALKIGGDKEEAARDKRRKLWESMRFFAFDSFEGLPELTNDDGESPDFQEGQFAFPVEKFQERVSAAGVPIEQTRIVKGWFSDTCVPETIEKYELKKAAVVWVDADLYSSTKTVLHFITDLLQDGTIIVFDDWFSFKGSPYAGEQKAFHEWMETIEGRFTLQEYQRESWKRMSFVVSRKPTV